MSTERAWAAGLFDGEGTIFASVHNRPERPRPQVTLRMALGMTEEAVVRRFAAVMGVGRVVHIPPREGNRKAVWRWQVAAEARVREALEVLWPWLSEPKRQQALRALSSRDAYKAVPVPLSPACRKRSHCKRGHDLSIHRYVAPGGGSYCRACRDERCQIAKDDAPLFNHANEVAV